MILGLDMVTSKSWRLPRRPLWPQWPDTVKKLGFLITSPIKESNLRYFAWSKVFTFVLCCSSYLIWSTCLVVFWLVTCWKLVSWSSKSEKTFLIKSVILNKFSLFRFIFYAYRKTTLRTHTLINYNGASLRVFPCLSGVAATVRVKNSNSACY